MVVSTETWLRPKDIAETMGVSVDTIHKMVHSGQLEGVKFGGQVRISQQSYLSYMQTHRIHPVTQAASGDKMRSCESYESSSEASEAGS